MINSVDFGQELCDLTTNSVDPDHTASRRSSVIRICTFCYSIKNQKNFLMIIYKQLLQQKVLWRFLVRCNNDSEQIGEMHHFADFLFQFLNIDSNCC